MLSWRPFLFGGPGAPGGGYLLVPTAAKNDACPDGGGNSPSHLSRKKSAPGLKEALK